MIDSIERLNEWERADAISRLSPKTGLISLFAGKKGQLEKRIDLSTLPQDDWSAITINRRMPYRLSKKNRKTDLASTILFKRNLEITLSGLDSLIFRLVDGRRSLETIRRLLIGKLNSSDEEMTMSLIQVVNRLQLDGIITLAKI